MQLPPSTSSADPSLAALLFPAATSSPPIGGTLAATSPGAEPSSLGFEQLFAELQPAASAPIATGSKANVLVAPVLPAKAEPNARSDFQGTFRPSPVASAPAENSESAPRFLARTGLAAPVGRSLKDVSGLRIQRLQSEPASQPGPRDDSAAQGAVLAATFVLPMDPLPAAVLPDTPSDDPIGDEMPDDPSALPDSSDTETLTHDDGRSDPREPSRFDAVMTAFRRAPSGFGNMADQQTRPLSVASPTAIAFSKADSGQASSASEVPEENLSRSPGSFDVSPAFGRRDSAALPVPAISEGKVAREMAPARALSDLSVTGLNRSATVQAMFRPESRDSGRSNLPVDPSRPLQAKFADPGLVTPGESKGFEKLGDKLFLSSQGKVVADVDATFGTTVANSQSAMVSFTNGAPSYPTSDQSGSVVSAMPAVRETANQTAVPVVDVSSAHEAVDAVLDVADRMQSRDQRSVNLEFTVGDAKLAVRVELQGNEVRTTFRTESSELRVALTHEWESVAGGNEDRTFRLAPPTITGTDTPARNDSFGDASARQQERQQERESREALNLRDPAADVRVRSGTPATGMPAPRATQSPLGTAQHLHHFA